jgi:hypothetical protein
VPGDAAAGSGRSAIRSSRGRLAEPARPAVTAVDEASLAEALSAAAGAGFDLASEPPLRVHVFAPRGRQGEAILEIVGFDERESARRGGPLREHEGILPCPAFPLDRLHEPDHRVRNPKSAVLFAIKAGAVEQPPVYFLCCGFTDRTLSHSAPLS